VLLATIILVNAIWRAVGALAAHIDRCRKLGGIKVSTMTDECPLLTQSGHFNFATERLVRRAKTAWLAVVICADSHFWRRHSLTTYSGECERLAEGRRPKLFST
jgi:hypothetical protein